MPLLPECGPPERRRAGCRSCPAALVTAAALLSAALPATPSQMNDHKNISDLLDGLLSGYDNSVRPDFGGPPAIIEVDIMVRSMGPISEVDMTYSMDCYFRQSWVDRRLAFHAEAKETLALSISMLKKIWKPDTYFYNGKQSYLHTITTPNKFVRLYQDGRVLYSSRLTIKAGCPMNLEDFPMDTQRCPLKFGSFGYTSVDVIYRWNRNRQVAIAEDMKLSQFDLIATPAANHTDTVVKSYTKDETNPSYISEYSMLLVSFHLQRHMGNFLIQVYGPCILLVVLSWVSFWLNREATADRVSLGITTVLTMTFLGLEARTDLPKVSYPTALDFFVFLSFGFIFATIIQFAVVHYFTKYGSGECYFSAELSSDSSSDEDEPKNSRPTCKTHMERPVTETRSASRKNSAVTMGNTSDASNFNDKKNGRDVFLLEVIPLRACTLPYPSGRRTSLNWAGLPCLGRQQQPTQYGASTTSNTGHRLSFQGFANTKKKKKRTPRYNSVSKIDRASRVVFPLLFLTINLFYWYSYLSRSQRIKSTYKS